jgi:hypothetical protein
MEGLGMLGVAIFPICLVPIAIGILFIGFGVFRKRKSSESQSLARILFFCILVAGLSMLGYVSMLAFPE